MDPLPRTRGLSFEDTPRTRGLSFEDIPLGARFTAPPVTLDPAHDPLRLVATCTATASAALGPTARLMRQSCRFVQPPPPGDPATPLLQVVALEPAAGDGLVVLRCTLHTQARALLMEGELHYRLHRRTDAGTDLCPGAAPFARPRVPHTQSHAP